jgi:hypothetical protein
MNDDVLKDFALAPDQALPCMEFFGFKGQDSVHFKKKTDVCKPTIIDNSDCWSTGGIVYGSDGNVRFLMAYSNDCPLEKFYRDYADYHKILLSKVVAPGTT